MSIFLIIPVLSFSNNAANIALLAFNPVITSIQATPTFTGGPSTSPVMLIIPDLACNDKSYPGSSFLGPVAPNPEIEHKITCSGIGPRSLSKVPGLKFSITTSASIIIERIFSLSSFKSAWITFFPRLQHK